MPARTSIEYWTPAAAAPPPGSARLTAPPDSSAVVIANQCVLRMASACNQIRQALAAICAAPIAISQTHEIWVTCGHALSVDKTLGPSTYTQIAKQREDGDPLDHDPAGRRDGTAQALELRGLVMGGWTGGASSWGPDTFPESGDVHRPKRTPRYSRRPMASHENPDFPSERALADPRNLIDHFKYWRHDAILAALDARRHEFVVVLENFAYDFNIATAIRNANAFLAREVWIVGRRRFDRRGAMGTHRYQHVHHTKDEPALLDASERRRHAHRRRRQRARRGQPDRLRLAAPRACWCSARSRSASRRMRSRPPTMSSTSRSTARRAASTSARRRGSRCTAMRRRCSASRPAGIRPTGAPSDQ